jgi:hypothetical protein
MWRSVAGMPRSENSVVTWCSDSGERLQKSHCSANISQALPALANSLARV